MREVVFRVLAERPGHLEAQAVGAAFSAGVTLPIRITAPRTGTYYLQLSGSYNGLTLVARQ